MDKIASPNELVAELRRLLAYSQTERPRREKLASALNTLADRVAGVKKEEVSKSEQGLLRDQVQRNKNKYHGPNGLKSGQKYKYQGKDWLILDFDAESGAPGGATLYLVSSDFKETVRGVEVPKSTKTASTNRTAGYDILDFIIDQREIGDIYEKLVDEDDQSAHLFRDVIDKLNEVLDLDPRKQEALSRVIDIVKRGKNWDIALLRNNVFKAANALGIHLPSGMF